MENEGRLSALDKVIRIIVALVLIWVGFTSSYAWAFYAISILLVVTVISDFCPIYYILGISTAKSKPHKISKKEIHKAVGGESSITKNKTETKKRSAKSNSKKTSTKKKSSSKGTKKKTAKKSTKSKKSSKKTEKSKK